MRLNKLNQRSMIKLLTKESNGLTIIHERIVAVYKQDVPSKILV